MKQLRDALEAIENNDTDKAHTILTIIEIEAFEKGRRHLAGECGYTRYALAHGHTQRAADTLRAYLNRNTR